MVKTVHKMMPVCSVTPYTLDLSAVFNVLEDSIIVLDAQANVLTINSAAEQLFAKSLSSLSGQRLAHNVPGTTGLENLAKRALAINSSITESALRIIDPVRKANTVVDVTATPVRDQSADQGDNGQTCVVLHLHERTLSQKIGRRLGYLGAARSITGMASVLAHEIKNPLSGIRGASQLLEENASEPDRLLTSLIRNEVDRICDLVDKMGGGSQNEEINLNSVNIHKVLDRVQQIAQNGFARDVTFTNLYDPSLPPVTGDQDQLIQVFLNLVKNACEASHESGDNSSNNSSDTKIHRITLSTAYRPGVRFTLSDDQRPRNLPLVVEVVDEGPGIPEELQEYLFEPFITTKPHGSGLGLPLSAKIIADHGGMIDFDSQPGKTVFRVLLPINIDTTAPVS